MFGCSCITRGNPLLPHLVFLHGLFGRKEDWKPILELLSHHYHCIAIDLPGHGQTAYREDMIRHFMQFLKEREQRPTLIGYSMGGRIALQLRECVRGVVAISAHVGLENLAEKHTQRGIENAWKHKLMTLSPHEFFTAWYTQPLFASLSENPSLLQQLIEQRSCQDPVILVQVIEQLSLSRQSKITDFPTPTLFIHGKKDSKYQQLYHNIQLPVACVDNAGHACLIENPQECGLTILTGLERLYANDTRRTTSSMGNSTPIYRY